LSLTSVTSVFSQDIFELSQGSSLELPQRAEALPVFTSKIISSDRDGVVIQFDANWLSKINPEGNRRSDLEADPLIELTGGLVEQSHTIELPVASFPRISIIESQSEIVSFGSEKRGNKTI